MTKETRKERKQEQRNNVPNSDSQPKLTMEHSKELDRTNKELKQIMEQFEELKKAEAERVKYTDGLQRFAKKQVDLSKASQISFKELKNEIEKLKTELLKEKNRFVEAETNHTAVLAKLIAENKELEATKANVNEILTAKEAECAAYLNDMKGKLEEATARTDELEQQNQGLQAELKALELQVQEKDQAAKEKNEAFDKLQADFQKQTKKFSKKVKRLNETKAQLQTLEAENVDIKNQLVVQGNKMRELQSVLNRPTIPKTAEVSPLNLETAPCENQARSSTSPDILINTQRSNNEVLEPRNLRSATSRSPQPSYAENDVSDSDEEHSGDGVITDESTLANTRRRRSTDSDDFNFPPYALVRPAQQNKNNTMGNKRVRFN